MSKIVLFQTIQFSISTQFSSIWPIDRTLPGATTPGQSGPGSDGNQGVLCIPQSSSITGTSPSDCLVSYHLYCYFHNVSTDMSSGLRQVFVELRNLHRASNYILYWIHGGHLFWFRYPWPGTSVKYSCIVTHLQSGLNLQPLDDCLLRSLGNQRL